MDNKNNSILTGISISGLWFITFLVLKLVGVIDWSWWWVTAPLWVPMILVIIIILVFLVIAAVDGKLE